MATMVMTLTIMIMMLAKLIINTNNSIEDSLIIGTIILDI